MQAPTQVTDAYMSAASGRRTHVLFEGSNNLLSPDHIVTEGSTAKIFHLGLPGIHAIDGCAVGGLMPTAGPRCWTGRRGRGC